MVLLNETQSVEGLGVIMGDRNADQPCVCMVSMTEGWRDGGLDSEG